MRVCQPGDDASDPRKLPRPVGFTMPVGHKTNKNFVLTLTIFYMGPSNVLLPICIYGSLATISG